MHTQVVALDVNPRAVRFCEFNARLNGLADRYAHMHACMHAHMHARMHAHMHAHMHARMHAHVLARRQVCHA